MPLSAKQKAERALPPPSPEPLAGQVFDSHTHFDAIAHRAGVIGRHEAASADFIADQVEQAIAVGVTTMINVGCEVGEWQSAVDSTANPAVYAALAVHPTEVRGLTDEHYAELHERLLHPRVVAVGETGLDYYWDRTTPSEQQEHFRRHIELAKSVGKPLMIHDRDAHADVLRLLAEDGAPEAGVIFHSFSGDAEMATECVRRGYYLSFSGVVTFANAPALREAAKVTPLTSMLVETDAPFLTPHPYRGRANAPYLIPHTLRALAECKQVSETVACDTIYANGQTIFRP